MKRYLLSILAILTFATTAYAYTPFYGGQLGNNVVPGYVLQSTGSSSVANWVATSTLGITGGGGGSGTVTSVSGSGGSTGLTLTGGPITTSGTLTLGGLLGSGFGGTGTTTNIFGYFLPIASSSLFYLATNPSNYITAAGAPVQSVFGRTGAVTAQTGDYSAFYPSYTYGSTTYYLASNPSNFISSAYASNTFPTFTYASSTFVTQGTASSSFVTYPYGSSTYYFASNPAGYITSAGTCGTNPCRATYFVATGTPASTIYGPLEVGTTTNPDIFIVATSTANLITDFSSFSTSSNSFSTFLKLDGGASAKTNYFVNANTTGFKNIQIGSDSSYPFDIQRLDDTDTNVLGTYFTINNASDISLLQGGSPVLSVSGSTGFSQAGSGSADTSHQFQIDSGASNIDPLIIKNRNSVGLSNIDFSDSSTNRGFIGYGNINSSLFPGIFFVGTPSASPVIFSVNSLEKARFDSNGFFGIGSTTPGSILSVQGSSTLSGTTPIFSIATTSVANTGTTTLFSVLGNGATLFNNQPGTLGYVLQSQGSNSSPQWVATSTLGITGGGGTGTVTSVAATVPTGLTVSGSPITTSGTLGFGLQSGYVIPLIASTTQWASAYASTTAISGTAPITYNGSTGAIGCNVASGSQAGCLSSTDWTTFNNKQPAGNYLTSQAWSIGNGFIYNATSTDRVVIGTSTPFAKLSIQNAFGSTTPLFDVSTTTSALFATSSLFNVQANGNVGIGTSSPVFPLSVNGNLYQVGTNVHFGNTTCAEGNVYYGGVGVELCGNDNSIGGGVEYIASNASTGTSAFSDYLLTNDQATSTGPNAGALYSVINYNGCNFNNAFYGAVAGAPCGLLLQNTNGPLDINTASSTNGIIRFTSGTLATTSPALAILTNGRLGIGTSTPGSGVFIQAQGGTTTGATAVPQFTVASSTGVSSLSVLANGNVGIGTSSPAYKLDINSGSASTQVHIGGGNTDSGGYLTSLNGSSLIMSGGAANNGSWFAKSTTASIINYDTTGAILFYSNTSLTPGNTFTPTARFVLNTNGGVGIGSFGTAIGSAPANGIAVSGNVGIGTSTPAFPLTVASSTGAKANMFSVDTLGRQVSGSSTAGVITLASGAATVSLPAGEIDSKTRVSLTIQNCSSCGTPYLNGTTTSGFTIGSTNVLDASTIFWKLEETAN